MSAPETRDANLNGRTGHNGVPPVVVNANAPVYIVGTVPTDWIPPFLDEPYDHEDAAETPVNSTAGKAATPARRPIAPAITQAVIDARGPNPYAKLVWLALWSYRNRDDAVRDLTQAELAELLGWCTDRTLREYLAECQRFGMLTNHCGLNGNSSLYVLHPPERWYTAPDVGRRACRPPKRRTSVAPPPGDPR